MCATRLFLYPGERTRYRKHLGKTGLRGARHMIWSALTLYLCRIERSMARSRSSRMQSMELC